MNRSLVWTWRVALLAAWAALVFSLDAITHDGNRQAWIAGAASAMAGLLIGRWWVLAMPFVAAVPVFVAAALSQCDSCGDDIPLAGWAAILLMYALFADTAMGAGVGLNRLLAIAYRRLRS